MLTSLGIKNYRNLKSLEIEKLARVNLIAGKNNTGKTSLLEAVSLYAYRGSLHWIDNILRERGEFFSERSRNLESNLKTYTSLFHNRKKDFFDSGRLLIGPLENVISSDEDDFLHHTLNIRIRHMYQVESRLQDVTDQEIVKTVKRWKILEDEQEDTEGLKMTDALCIGFSKRSGYAYQLSGLDRENDFQYIMNELESLDNIQFVRTIRTDEENALAWDKITSTEKEQYLVKALRLIEDDINSISFIKDVSSLDGRNAVVGLKGNKSRLPIRSMGDGMNRILTIILALVNSEDGYLLIDEFENGLHYTVQEDLWRMIFQLAKELNVQVFATTHSNDCIRAFENVLNDGNESEGQYFRLEKFGDAIKPIFYSSSDLEAAVDQHIETR